eukprot:TRINITY_DN33471_c0_g1_i1.p1 TRINITY_DN33471_c0_g1~~TRINITY_DN33471_c0_g1_i1.p1  ORF type:complete len:534 (+),score=62.14 TRINITY_DN33471_c0_g1_i1:128-1729(+)
MTSSSTLVSLAISAIWILSSMVAICAASDVDAKLQCDPQGVAEGKTQINEVVPAAAETHVLLQSRKNGLTRHGTGTTSAAACPGSAFYTYKKMDSWYKKQYKGRLTDEADCDWLCTEGSRSERCQCSVFSRKSKGTCRLYEQATTTSTTTSGTSGTSSTTSSTFSTGPTLCSNLEGGRDEFTLPLFLYWSSTARDILTITCEAATAAGIHDDYELLDALPVAFISPNQTEIADRLLHLHYSEKRKDYVTTAKEPETHNGYVTIASLGYISSVYVRGEYGIAEISRFWSSSNTDIASVPFANNNLLNDLIGQPNAFRSRGGVEGYVAVGTCSLCNTVMSPSYGAEGGPGCPYRCDWGKHSGTAVYKFDEDAFLPMAANQERAEKIVEAHGTPRKEYSKPHMSFAYYCCMSSQDLCKMKQVLDDFDWASHPTKVEYDKVVVNVDRPGYASMVVQVTKDTQLRMLELWSLLNLKFMEAGVSEVYPREKQYMYHNTLVQVSYPSFRVDETVRSINKQITNWTLPIMVAEKPEIRFCQ